MHMCICIETLTCPDQGEEQLRLQGHISVVFASFSLTMLILRVLLEYRMQYTAASFLSNWSLLADITAISLAFISYILIYCGIPPGHSPSTNYTPFEWAYVPELILSIRLVWRMPFFQR